jgi:hypothetical protein
MMTHFACITSMSKKYYDFCGKEMLNSYLKYADHIPLYLYNEDFEIDMPFNMQGWNLGEDYENFAERWNGKKKHKVATFAKKGFSIIHAMENIDCDRLIWIDADCILQQKLDIKFLEQLSDEEILSTHFSVNHIKGDESYHSCETGFFILNTQHKIFEQFKNTYKEIYVNDQTENLRRFYDGEVYGETVNRLNGPWMQNLNTGLWKTPIKRSEVGKYIHHYKGKGLKDSVFN